MSRQSLALLGAVAFAGSPFLYPEFFFWDAPEGEFIRAWYFIILGGVVALPFGLFLNRWWQSLSDAEQARSVLRATKEALDRSLTQLDEAMSSLQSDIHTIPAFHFDIGTLEATATKRHELLQDVETLTAIGRATFSMTELNRRFDQLHWTTLAVRLRDTGIDPPLETELLDQQQVDELCEHAQPYIPRLIEAIKRRPFVTEDSFIVISLKLGIVKRMIGEGGGVRGECQRAIELIDRQLPP